MALNNGLGGGTGIAGILDEINSNTIITGTTKLHFRDAGIFLQSDIDGVLVISADGVTGNTVKIQLNDKIGDSNFVVLDSDGFPMMQFDSDGNVRQKGTVQRTLTG